jgi:hypothetical protein
MYATDYKEDYVLRKLQHDLNSTETWCKRWNIKINEDKTRAIHFSHRLRPPEVHLTLYGQYIPFLNHYKTPQWDLQWVVHGDCIWKWSKTRPTGLCLRTIQNQVISTNIKLTLHKALIRSLMIYVCPAWEFASDTPVLKLQCLQRFFATLVNFQGAHQSVRCTWFSSYRLWLHNKTVQAISRGNTK